MKHYTRLDTVSFRFALIALTGLSLASGALAATGTAAVTTTGTVPAPTVSVALTDTTGTALPATYAIGQLNNTSFTYGSNFLVQLTYANVVTNVSLALSGTQSNYLLAYEHTPSGGTLTSGVSFATSIGTVTTSGTATATYASGITTTPFTGYSTTTTGATSFAIGAKATTAAVVGLSTPVTLTVTAN